MTPSTGVSNQSIRYTILVKGYVQRVSYRDIVEQIARIHHLTGYVQNLEGYDVGIVVEGSEPDLEQFARDIIITRKPIHVDSIDVHEDPATGEYPYFKIKRGSPDEELG
ncbi:MAG: acylphosphatase, partial [Methanospirillum sp.]|uniref:acylphosphatase n=1 Tax=Methanospirillum sp. TaxID=45200 RepID=UPI00236F1CE4